MAGGRRIPVTVEADTDGNFDKAARGLEDVAKSGDKADASLGRLSKGHQALDAEINKVGYSLKALRSEFERTGDLKLLPDIDKQQRTLTKMRAQFAKIGDDVHESFWSKVFMLGGTSIPNALIPQMSGIGEQSASVFAGGFRGAVGAFAGPAALAFGVPLLASLSGIIAGASTGALGLGAIAVGIAAQLQNERIRAAADDLGQTLKTRILVATEGLQQPIVDAFHVLARESEPFFVGIRHGFDAIAPYVTNLAVRIGEGFGKIGPMIGDALARSGPILGVIGNGIEMLIVAVGRFFSEVSKAGAGGAAAMDMIFRALSGLITGLGIGIRLGAELFGVFVRIGAAGTAFLSNMLGAVLKLVDWIPKIGKFLDMMNIWKMPADFMKNVNEAFDKGTLSSGNFAASLGGLGTVATNTAGSLTATSAAAWSVKGAFDAASGGSIALLQAQLNGQNALRGFNQALQDSNGSLDIHTAKGAAAMQAALGLRDAAIQVGQATFEQTHSSAAASQAIEGYRGAMVDAMVQSGKTKDEAQALTDQLLGIPPDVKTNVTSTAPQATADVREHSRMLDSVNGKTANTYVNNYVTTVTSAVTRVSTEYVSSAGGGRQGGTFGFGGIIPAAARGLIASGPVLLGERTVPEAAIPAPNSGISSQRAAGLLGTAAGWWGMDVVPRSGYGASVTPTGRGASGPAVMQVQFGGDVDSAFASAFMGLVRAGRITIQSKAVV